MPISGGPDPDYDALRGRPTLSIPFPNSATGGIAASEPVYTKKCILVGWSVRETAGATAVYELAEGGGLTGGPPVAEISLAANGESHEAYADHGPYCQSGLFLLRSSGSIRGAIFIKA